MSRHSKGTSVTCKGAGTGFREGKRPSISWEIWPLPTGPAVQDKNSQAQLLPVQPARVFLGCSRKTQVPNTGMHVHLAPSPGEQKPKPVHRRLECHLWTKNVQERGSRTELAGPKEKRLTASLRSIQTVPHHHPSPPKYAKALSTSLTKYSRVFTGKHTN